ncbi:ankyrin repeat-containing domain protein [Microdochium trichocladiopsis]|uniref:Ankyrin repeat-containing domain protein n=1 Tax=Microdochium trichocladiopsis TaxID=1682393 RepID=A0A9P8YC61_9PEZI|nr:ankyrin repeat-containing domain protein [Microdochium trichocladiopsis]KAH7033614.1 ankyrin repeat-containing domain protein [Microdochium trichocladiopsis]
MAPKLSEEEIDDLIYLARAGEDAGLSEMLGEIAQREGSTPAEVLSSAKDETKATCLHMAAANGHSKTVTLILSHLPITQPKKRGASSPTSQEETATSSSTQNDSSSQPATSTPEAPYIDAQNTYGNAALHWACLGGHLDVVKLLLSRGASPTVANDKDQIPLDLAAFNSHMHVVDYFLSQSRDLEGDNAQAGGLEGGVKDVEMSVEEEVEEVADENAAGPSKTSA